MKHAADILKVWAANGFAFGIATLSDLETVAKILLMTASLVYTVLKIVKLIRHDKRSQHRK